MATAYSSTGAYYKLKFLVDGSENEVNITSVSNMASAGETKNKTTRRTYAQDYFSLKGEESDVYQYAKGTVNAPEDTKKSILSVFLSKIRIFSTREELSEMLSYTDFNMENIGKEKTAVFMIVHDEKTTYHSLVTIFIKLMDCDMIVLTQHFILFKEEVQPLLRF